MSLADSGKNPDEKSPATARTGEFHVALTGNPNCGKTTVFNALTGLRQHTGNWPGKTVEKRSGVFSLDGNSYNLVDLPGTYSLTANSPEEVIAREYILRDKPNVVIAVVSAANLERSLYLVSELVSLPAPVVVALNMMDVAEQEGMLLGGSAAINIAGAIRLAKEMGPGHTIVTILCDYGQRYQSKLFNPAFLRSKKLPVPAWLERKSDLKIPFEKV